MIMLWKYCVPIRHMLITKTTPKKVFIRKNITVSSFKYRRKTG